MNSLRTDVDRARAGLGVILGGLLALAVSSTALAQEARVVTVDCAQGETIAKALTRGNETRPLVVLVRGTCDESVTIDRSDVTLRGDPSAGGRINGPDANVDTVRVTASRATLEELTITGGRNGVTGSGSAGLTVRNATIQNTGRSGVAFVFGASGVVDGCTIQFNPRDGVTIAAAQATVVNSVLSQNRNGVLVLDGGSARIGVDNRNVPGGNTINLNGSSGIVVSNGSAASIAMNQISGNGADPAAPGGGILVLSSAATIAGGNTISGNATQGVFARSASVVIGDPGFGLPTVNTITGNGSGSAGGVFGILGTSMVVRDAVISGNSGVGLGLSLRSQAQLFGSTIQNNPGDGIRLLLGSALLILPPNTTVSGNTGFGLLCLDGESSVANTGLLSLSGNSLGDVSPGCTGF